MTFTSDAVCPRDMNLIARAPGRNTPPDKAARRHQSRAAGRRRAWRVHLGRARPSAARRAARDRRHFRHLGRRDQCRDAGRRAVARRSARRRASGLPNSGAPQAATATCRRCNARSSDRLFSFIPIAASPFKAWFDAMSRYLSPYDLNPLNINPLKDLIERFVDFDALRADAELQLFIAATNVHTGRLRVFAREKITADAVMASACLPLRVPRGRDRRRALLGRRLHRQPGDLSVLPHHRDRGRAGGADQPAGAAWRRRRSSQRDHEPHQRDHLQLLADRRIPRHRVRRAG